MRQFCFGSRDEQQSDNLSTTSSSSEQGEDMGIPLLDMNVTTMTVNEIENDFKNHVKQFIAVNFFFFKFNLTQFHLNKKYRKIKGHRRSESIRFRSEKKI